MKNITILGSTGSIGVNALNILGNIELDFKISYLTANHNSDLMIKQCKEFHPKAVIMIDEKSAEKVYQEVSKEGIEVLVGRENLLNIVSNFLNYLNEYAKLCNHHLLFFQHYIFY